jgi:hypothetical protein
MGANENIQQFNKKCKISIEETSYRISQKPYKNMLTKNTSGLLSTDKTSIS